MRGTVAEAVRVLGLRDLQRAFALADKTVKDDMRDALMEAAAPVRADAQTLAGSMIRNVGVGDPWARMRIGASGSTVWVAPVERGVKGRANQRKRRPNLAPLLMDRAMQPALDHNVHKVERRVEHLLDEVANVWERT